MAFQEKLASGATTEADEEAAGSKVAFADEQKEVRANEDTEGFARAEVKAATRAAKKQRVNAMYWFGQMQARAEVRRGRTRSSRRLRRGPG